MVVVSHIHNPGNQGGISEGTITEFCLLCGSILANITFPLRAQEGNGAGVQSAASAG